MVDVSMRLFSFEGFFCSRKGEIEKEVLGVRFFRLIERNSEKDFIGI